MDAVQKAKFEQRMVLVLLVIFVAALFHTLTRLGVLGGKRTPGKPPGALATTVQQIQRHEQADSPLPPQIPPQYLADSPSSLASVADPPRTVAGIPIVEYTAEGVRDPLTSLLTSHAQGPTPPSPAAGGPAEPGAVPKPPAVTIQGIIVGERPQAIIDRTLYQVGDTVQGVARIVAIDHAGVILEVQGFQFLVSPTGAATLVNPVGGER